MYQLRPKALVKKADPILLGKAGGFSLIFVGNGLDDMAVIQNGLLFIAAGPKVEKLVAVGMGQYLLPTIFHIGVICHF